MAFKDINQPDIIEINEEIRLRNIEEDEWQLALPWYKNPKIMYYSEGVNEGSYNMDIINRMYKYLNTIGELYFIEALEDGVWKAIGDVTLSEKNMPIVIGDEKYWGKKIGSLVIKRLIDRAKIIGLKKIYIPSIYKYNIRSRSLFTSIGFIKVAENEREESFELIIN